jgi:hypothetical protein
MYESKTFPVERRRHPRTHLQMTLGCIRLDPDGGDVVDSLQMTDISLSGLGARCQRPYYPGQRIVLSLPLPTSAGRKNVYATITRCTQLEKDFKVGFEFDAPYVGHAYGYAPAAATIAA